MPYEPLMFHSYAQYKACFDWAERVVATFCQALETSEEELYLTKYGDKICLKQ